jgi:hypothetical protein
MSTNLPSPSPQTWPFIKADCGRMTMAEAPTTDTIAAGLTVPERACCCSLSPPRPIR